MGFTPFRCCECGNMVEMKTGAGRTYLHRRDDERPIPDDMLIPTCTKCGETFWTENIFDELARLAEPARHHGGQGNV